MIIQILVDNPNSWVIPYANQIVEELKSFHSIRLIFQHEHIQKGDILILLSCEKKLKSLSLNTHNLVVHGSDLPKGKGWSPLTWLVLEGHDKLPITLIEAVDQIDAGDIYAKKWIALDGTELIDELRLKQGEATIELIKEFIDKYPNINATRQTGEESFYKKRKAEDSRLDPTKTIEEQFNLLRVVDNQKYPAFFDLRGERYYIRISKK